MFVITLISPPTISTDDSLFSWTRLLAQSSRLRSSGTVTNGRAMDLLIVMASFGSKEAFQKKIWGMKMLERGLLGFGGSMFLH
jgi:hypothetical protein